MNFFILFGHKAKKYAWNFVIMAKKASKEKKVNYLKKFHTSILLKKNNFFFVFQDAFLLLQLE